jgi:DNA-binding transcriptional ArsR family regulator
MTQKNNRTGPPAARVACCGGLAGRLVPRVFKALADPTRAMLVVRLAEAGCPCTVGELAAGQTVDLSVVSRHLGLLRDAGVVACERRGKEVYCTVRVHEVAAALRELATALEACAPPPGNDEQPGQQLDVAAETHEKG